MAYFGGNDSKNWLRGTDGDDIFSTNAGNDTVFAASGNDLIYAHAGRDLLYGEGGNDTLDGGNGSDTMDGGSGDDVLYAGDDAAPDRLAGALGNDTFWVNGPEDTVVEYANQGIDTVRAKFSWQLGPNLENATLQEVGAWANGSATGNGLNNLLVGNSGNNRLYGLAGNDTIDGCGGNDTVWAGNGNDRVDGGAGNDLIYGMNGQDSLFGGVGDDTVRGENGADLVVGSYGDDVLYGGNGGDNLYSFSMGEGGDLGHDVFIAGPGDDTILDGTLRNPPFSDRGDVFLFQKGASGFGNDRLEMFNLQNDQLVFSGYRSQDLSGPVRLTSQPYMTPGQEYWQADFSFRDGSALHVTGVSIGAPQMSLGSQYVFAGANWERRAARNDWAGVFRDKPSDGGAALFAGTDGAHGDELWSTNGASAHLIKDRECQEFRAWRGYPDMEGDPPWPDAKSLLSRTRSSTSCWLELTPRRPSIRTACSTS
ncbi:hypothetical protein M5E06_16710 [Azospirillum sp. A1-3]|uniref:calcium-binding protein n=1 Tax=Azospirillum sp. A1-3 TaxID=185874 RepID=UPI002077641E|nr:calcium-binding protein [Azospirillum sp. A1-3]MCM8735785.1 hypothetical protein [Azospirillum sp. A1-3]